MTKEKINIKAKKLDKVEGKTIFDKTKIEEMEKKTFSFWLKLKEAFFKIIDVINIFK